MENTQFEQEHYTVQELGYFGYLIKTLESAHIFDLLKLALLAYFLLLLVLTVFGKSKGKGAKSVSTRERLLKRFLFANQDILGILDDDDKKLLTQTFENTLKNAKAVDMKEPDPSPNDAKKFQRKVDFNLQKIQYHTHVPYESD
ncbi:hypothetical protein PPERSA_01352 [Pseudocohnilembus persalinus]|uniref:Uncharacterized protein n=1 Tax=Pseudocohnilembus persalinus TaxID=266149 RepID=A0A0V0QGW4_PSEPJ|nr:hypothetical protein PPERSA_01352 [Pseudocohnilembus persalinus]|eukprot:KRX01449.1 hypothetical protein PPERSA_01352 [Pseudocohnilembus persalinus]